MRILIVAEGRHEHQGALEALLRRIISTQWDCERARLACGDIHTFHGKGPGFFKKALRWMLEAKKRGFDAVVLVADEDGCPERRSQMDSAQSHVELTTIKRALGIAIRSFDSWMLADEQALSHTLEYDVPRQSAPESIRDPKGVCVRLLADSPNRMGQAAMYAAVAECADIAILADRCPDGFAPFAGRVRALQPVG